MKDSRMRDDDGFLTEHDPEPLFPRRPPEEDVRCCYEGCDRQATMLALGRQSYSDKPGHPTVAHYCDAHAEIVADEGSPEYVKVCPYCGCLFGVN